VVELSLPKTRLDRVQVGKVIQHMQLLQKLDVEWSFGLMRLLVISNQVKELTIRCREKISQKFAISLNLFLFLLTGKDLKFKPQNINIVGVGLYLLADNNFKNVWPSWIFNLPFGHIVNVRVYERMKTPLDLFPALPDFQFKFGQTANKFEVVELDFLTGLHGELPVMHLHDRIIGNTVEVKALLFQGYNDSADYCYKINYNNGCLNFVTDIDLRFYNWLSSDHLKQLSVTCPNLKRLDLRYGYNCLKSLKGLRAIASCCRNLQGINLFGIQVTDVEDQIQLWEILSDMKLTHLGLETCNIMPFKDDDAYKQTLMKLYQKFSHLQAISVKSNVTQSNLYNCLDCVKFDSHHIFLLSKFPSLAYVRFKTSVTSTVIQDVLISCKEIKFFCFLPYFFPDHLSLPSELTICNLQQLLIREYSTDIPDKFMNAVSAHGRLLHVILLVNSVSCEGVAALIMNSPELFTFHVSTKVECFASGTKGEFKKRFSYRRLFNCGSFEVREHQDVLRANDFFKVIADVTSSLFRCS